MGAIVYCLCNQKGGCAKTVTSVNLGIGLAREGKRVLVCDVDSQGSLTASLGWQQPDQIEVTLSTILGGILQDDPLPPGSGILHHAEGIDFRTVAKVKRQINLALSIAGILVTMADMRTNYVKDIVELLHANYDGKLRIFESIIPLSVRAQESNAEGKSIYLHDPAGKVAAAYTALTKEVLAG